VQQRPQRSDQRGVTEVVGGHLPLEALRAELQRPAHDTGVADQGGEVVVAVEQRLGAARDLVEVGQVELDDARRARPLEARRGLLALGGVAHRQHNMGAASDQFAGHFEADAAVGASHHERASDKRRGHIVIAILPRACPAVRCRIASGTSANGYVVSTAGVTLRASMSGRSASR